MCFSFKTHSPLSKEVLSNDCILQEAENLAHLLWSTVLPTVWPLHGEQRFVNLFHWLPTCSVFSSLVPLIAQQAILSLGGPHNALVMCIGSNSIRVARWIARNKSAIIICKTPNNSKTNIANIVIFSKHIRYTTSVIF